MVEYICDFLHLINVLYVHGCFFMHIYLYIMCMPGAQGWQKKTSDLLGLELQMTMNTMWMLGSDLRFSGRATSMLNHRAISLVPFS